MEIFFITYIIENITEKGKDDAQECTVASTIISVSLNCHIDFIKFVICFLGYVT